MKDEKKPRGQMTFREKFKWLLRKGQWGVWTATNEELDAATSIDRPASERAGEQVRNRGSQENYAGFKWWFRFIVAAMFFKLDDYAD